MVTTPTIAAGPADPVVLRKAMVDRLVMQGIVATRRVEDAMRTVARHSFVPGVGLDEAYGFDPVVTHFDGAGVAVSSASAPGTVAAMLEQLDVHPGHRVLEIGSGTGSTPRFWRISLCPMGQ